ncbi:MAG: LamG-like jellyroll fold domain-containing protein, partial [Ktedonobacterales bacterium]
VYQSALSTAQIASHYSVGEARRSSDTDTGSSYDSSVLGSGSLVDYWPLNGSLQNAKQTSGHDLNVSQTNFGGLSFQPDSAITGSSQSWQVNPAVSTAGSTTDTQQLVAQNDQSIDGTGTLELWVKTPSPMKQVELAWNMSGGKGWALYLLSNGTIQWQHASSSTRTVTTGNALAANTWYYINVTWRDDGNTSEYIYLNGSQVTTSYGNSRPTAPYDQASYPLHIGQSGTGGYGVRIAHVAWYSCYGDYYNNCGIANHYNNR